MPPPPSRRRVLVGLDVVLGVALVALSDYALTQPWDDGFRTHSGWLDVAAVSAMSAPFALRTLAPARGLGLLLAGQLVAGLVGPHTVLFYSGFVPLLVLVYAVARHDDGWPGRLAPLATPVLILGDLAVPEVRALDNLVFTGLLVTATWGAGRLARRLARQGEALGVALARLGLERAAVEHAAVELERTRIAAEMHDVAGHALSLMVLQTVAARAELAAGGVAALAQDQLRSAESAGRSALDELRRTLGVLRRMPAETHLQVEADTSPR